MVKVCKKEQVEELKAKYSKEMIKEVAEIIRLLDENYGENREIDKDLGGYIVILEPKKDVTDIKANIIKGHLQSMQML